MSEEVSTSVNASADLLVLRNRQAGLKRTVQRGVVTAQDAGYRVHEDPLG